MQCRTCAPNVETLGYSHPSLRDEEVKNTRFEMNEKGVELRSEAHMAFGCGMEAPPVRQHRMVFDKPFLLLMERAEAKIPYFALWVDNAELLVPW
jgi:serine protease inhibitor